MFKGLFIFIILLLQIATIALIFFKSSDGGSDLTNSGMKSGSHNESIDLTPAKSENPVHESKDEVSAELASSKEDKEKTASKDNETDNEKSNDTNLVSKFGSTDLQMPLVSNPINSN
jgi:hypothetical protein